MPEQNKPRQVVLRLVVLACFVNLATGCFVSQPVEGTPPPATDVQVRLTEQAAQRISTQAGRAVENVAGRIVQVDADSLILSVRWREIAGGSTGRPGADVVRLARSEVEEIRRPQFSLTRTLLLGGAVALLAAVVGGLLGAAGGSPPGDGGGPPDPT